MILLDLNQVMISNLMMQLQRNNDEIEESMIRHMILNSIRLYNVKFGEEYGEMVITCDDKNYWRKDIFPYYKACLLYTSPSPRDQRGSRMPSSG